MQLLYRGYNTYERLHSSNQCVPAVLGDLQVLTQLCTFFFSFVSAFIVSLCSNYGNLRLRKLEKDSLTKLHSVV